MGLIEKIFGRAAREIGGGYFKTMTAYAPVFTSWGGALYESELVRAAVDAKARHISKLQVTVAGSAKPRLRTRLRAGPNSWMTWSKFLYRTSTILDMQNNVFIVPVLDEYGETSGIFPLVPANCELVEHAGEVWIRYKFRTGQTAALPFRECALLTRHQYEDDFFGAKNTALKNTMELMHLQTEGISEAVKNSNTYRFMAKASNFAKAEDLKKERQRFTAANLRGEGDGGVLLFPNTYSDIRQIVGKPYVVDTEQIKMIRENVYDYFGVNSKILQNSAIGDEWSAFYEGAMEPFAVQLSETVSAMLFSENERARGSALHVSANRLQYMSNKDKLDVSEKMADRGLMMIDEIRDIWNLPPLPDGKGQVFIIRGEYKNAYDQVKGEDSNAGETGEGIQGNEPDADPQQSEQ